MLSSVKSHELKSVGSHEDYLDALPLNLLKHLAQNIFEAIHFYFLTASLLPVHAHKSLEKALKTLDFLILLLNGFPVPPIV